jgi:WXG100 family type VII secretion target
VGSVAGTIGIGSEEFKVDLEQLHGAIGQVGRDRGVIQDCFNQITAQFDGLQANWQGPAAETYDDLRTALQNATTAMLHVLDEIVSRMQTTYQNYESAESSNARNLT